LNDPVKERERTVLKLHGHSAERLKCRGEFEKLEDHGLILAEHLTTGDSEKKAVADLAGCARDGNTNGVFHHSVGLVEG
jgi:hypothetical protein